MAASVKWLIEFGDISLEIVATEVEVDGVKTVRFEIVNTSGEEVNFDLNGLFVDVGDDGGELSSVGSNANNMRGSSSNEDGVALDGFDWAEELGTIGGNDEDYREGIVDISFADLGITSLEDLDGAQIGLRLTSTGEDREGSLKLTGNGTYDPGEGPPDQDDFPLWGQDISNVILVFNQTIGDTKPDGGDGYYTVKIDGWPGAADDDLDNSIEDILEWLIANDDYVTADSDLLGAIIKGGQQDTNFFAYGDNNANGTDPDMPPDGLGLSWDGSANPAPASAVDQSYDYDTIFFDMG